MYSYNEKANTHRAMCDHYIDILTSTNVGDEFIDRLIFLCETLFKSKETEEKKRVSNNQYISIHHNDSLIIFASIIIVFFNEFR